MLVKEHSQQKYSVKLQKKIRKIGNEYGTTTGRERRIGWLDTVILKHGKRVSGITNLAVTLLDVLTGFDKLKICVAYNLDGKNRIYSINNRGVF